MRISDHNTGLTAISILKLPLQMPRYRVTDGLSISISISSDRESLKINKNLILLLTVPTASKLKRNT